MKTVLCKNDSCGNTLTVEDSLFDEAVECEQCHNNRSLSYTDRMLSEDICINKHKGNSASVEADKKVRKEIDRLRVLTIIREQGQASSKMIARIMGKELHHISGRISELKSEGIIEDTGIRKEGCALLKVASKQLHFF